MKVNRLDSVSPYEAPGHSACTLLRLQGFDASDAEGFWVGLSHFLPGGGAERSATPIEKVYVVVAGEVTVTTDEGEVTLSRLDSCWLAAGEARAVENRSNEPASMLVMMPYPEQSQ